jgi:hypothetical protein
MRNSPSAASIANAEPTIHMTAVRTSITIAASSVARTPGRQHLSIVIPSIGRGVVALVRARDLHHVDLQRAPIVGQIDGHAAGVMLINIESLSASLVMSSGTPITAG